MHFNSVISLAFRRSSSFIRNFTNHRTCCMFDDAGKILTANVAHLAFLCQLSPAFVYARASFPHKQMNLFLILDHVRNCVRFQLANRNWPNGGLTGTTGCQATVVMTPASSHALYATGAKKDSTKHATNCMQYRRRLFIYKWRLQQIDNKNSQFPFREH